MPDAKKKRLRPGHARVEFLAVKQEVDALLEKGHTLMGAYDLLREEGKITMSYPAFHKNYTGKTERRAKLTMRVDRERKAPEPPTVPALPAKPAAQPLENGCGVPPEPKPGPKILEKPADGFRDKLPDDNF